MKMRQDFVMGLIGLGVALFAPKAAAQTTAPDSVNGKPVRTLKMVGSGSVQTAPKTQKTPAQTQTKKDPKAEVKAQPVVSDTATILEVDPYLRQRDNYVGTFKFKDNPGQHLYFVGKGETKQMMEKNEHESEMVIVLKESKQGWVEDRIDLLDDATMITYMVDRDKGEKVMLDLAKGTGSIMPSSAFTMDPKIPLAKRNAAFLNKFKQGQQKFEEKYGQSYDKCFEEISENFGLPNLSVMYNLDKVDYRNFIFSPYDVTRADVDETGQFLYLNVTGQEEGEELRTVVKDSNGNGLFGDQGDQLAYTMFEVPGSNGKKTAVVNFITNQAGIIKSPKDDKMPDIETAFGEKANKEFKETYKDVARAAQWAEDYYGVFAPKFIQKQLDNN